MMGLAIMMGGYFLGAVGGQVYQKWHDSRQADHHVAGDHSGGAHDAAAHDAAAHDAAAHEEVAAPDGPEPSASDPAGTVAAPGNAGEAKSSAAPVVPLAPASNRPQPIGIFFSIYYCMTGLHAFHVIGGMVALSWLYFRCLKAHWRPDYFGPVDFVGLYWHLVDLIWIFLFPLLYLIK
jgi:cytochrome c oxidase subunit 3